MASLKLSLLTRSLSTSSMVSQMVKPPIQVFGIEGRYAHALFSAASKQKQIDNVEKELKSFQESSKADPKLKELVDNPTIRRETKSLAMKQIATAAKYSSTTSNFLQLLAENGRLRKLDGMINAYNIIMAAYRGEVTCEITTATPLKPDQQQKLEAVLKAFVKPNEKILVTSKVNPAILGGMLVSIGDKYVDMSIATKIKRYTDVISAAV
ncbi:ATP synthase subunit O, mitochondrial [Chrysoperla carnea]|uniref:ATP synthase subunit O, mitochondrial n=1 Tax=Chrysoperla carnea TaxID=189513 RepID=UPI001D0697A4|nr:ATP synthase subunit O, mitochondrial [Chrysoperla carnea]